MLMATARWLLLCSEDYLRKNGAHGISMESGCYWHCPLCIKRYFASQDFPNRTIHIHNPSAKGNQRVLVSAFVGEIPDGVVGGRNLSVSISLLKTTSMMNAIGDKEATVSLMLEALNVLEIEAETRLSDYYGESKVRVKSGDHRLSERYYGHQAVCEDSRLSISHIGQPLIGFLLDANKMPTLTVKQLQLWIDVMCSFAIFDEIKITGKAHKKEYRAILDSVAKLSIADRVSTGGDLEYLSRL
jgi:hypothetical protein